MRAIRHPRAAQSPDAEALPGGFDQFDGHRYLLLASRRRNGSTVAVPMWFAISGPDRIVLRSGAEDPKIARIRRDPAVTIAPCTFRGEPLAAPVPAHARILTGPEQIDAERRLADTLGPQRRLYNLFRAPLLPMAYIELTVTAATHQQEG